MLYSILIYGPESVIESLSDAEHEAVLGRHRKVNEKLAAEGRLGPSAKLMPSTTAVALRADKGEPMVLDGPFAETKEQLLGFYVIDCDSLEAAVEVANSLPMEHWSMEIRPVEYFGPGVLPQRAEEA